MTKQTSRQQRQERYTASRPLERAGEIFLLLLWIWIDNTLDFLFWYTRFLELTFRRRFKDFYRFWTNLFRVTGLVSCLTSGTDNRNTNIRPNVEIKEISNPLLFIDEKNIIFGFWYMEASVNQWRREREVELCILSTITYCIRFNWHAWVLRHTQVTWHFSIPSKVFSVLIPSRPLCKASW